MLASSALLEGLLPTISLLPNTELPSFPLILAGYTWFPLQTMRASRLPRLPATKLQTSLCFLPCFPPSPHALRGQVLPLCTELWGRLAPRSPSVAVSYSGLFSITFTALGPWDPSIRPATVRSISFLHRSAACTVVCGTDRCWSPAAHSPFVSFENKTPLVWPATRCRLSGRTLLPTARPRH